MSAIVDFCQNKKLHIIKKENGENIIQHSSYIEDGWFILFNKEETKFSVFEIPLFGGEEELIDNY